jgi:hypothetical protein
MGEHRIDGLANQDANVDWKPLGFEKKWIRAFGEIQFNVSLIQTAAVTNDQSAFGHVSIVGKGGGWDETDCAVIGGCDAKRLAV